MEWRDHLLTTPAQIESLLSGLRRVAVLGMRSERHPERAAYYVPLALQNMGLKIVPVPVYEREVTQMLGEPVYRSLQEIPGPVDLVDVFRRPEDLEAHLPDILAKRPAAVWLQTGIWDDDFAERLAREGIKVVQNRCLMVEYRRLGGH